MQIEARIRYKACTNGKSLLVDRVGGLSSSNNNRTERTIIMANIKSAKKRILTAERNHERNVAYKSMVKTAVKSVLSAAQAKDSDALKAALSNAYKLCDKGVSKGIFHKNTAARKKSRLTKAVNKLLAE